MMRNVFIILLALVIISLLPVPVFADGSVTGSFSTGDDIPPAAVTDLSISGKGPVSITLRWTAPGDDDTTGTAVQYDIRYSTSPITSEAEWNAATPVGGIPSPQPAGTNETFEVGGLYLSSTYWFALKTADEVPNWSDLSNTAGSTTEVAPVWLGPQPTTPETYVPEPASPQLPRLEVRIGDEIFFGSLDENGALVDTMEFTSADGNMVMTIQQGTQVTGDDGNRVDLIVIETGELFVGTQDDYRVIDLYRFDPPVTFSQPVLLKLSYSPLSLANSRNEGELRLAIFEPEQGQWIVLPGSMDIASHTVQAMITRVSILGILEPMTDEEPVKPVTPPSLTLPLLRTLDITLSSPEVYSGDSLTVSARVMNDGDIAGTFTVPVVVDGSAVTSKDIYLEPGQVKSIVEKLVAGEAGMYRIEIGTMSIELLVKRAPPPLSSPPPGDNWATKPLFWGMISGVSLLVVLTFFEFRRRKIHADKIPDDDREP
jgi:hypothetical protein